MYSRSRFKRTLNCTISKWLAVIIVFALTLKCLNVLGFPPKRIGIVVVLTNNTNQDQYKFALESVKCYSKIQGYHFIIAIDSEYDCKQKDKFFRRHCVVSRILPNYDAVLFLDADMGVVNPKKKIEEYMSDAIDVTFYSRFFNWEIAAGSYIAKNTPFAIDLLQKYADYELQLPKSFSGTDNGAIHIFLAEQLFPEASMEIENCRKVYNKSKNYYDLFTYEACIRHIFGSGTDFGKVRIMRKGTAWARDCWLTSCQWNPQSDFFLHGWKTGQLRKTPKNRTKPVEMGRAQWYNPINGEFDLARCHSANSSWSYDPILVGSLHEITQSLKRFQKSVAVQQLKSFAKIVNFL